jgi:hypothetical protein
MDEKKLIGVALIAGSIIAALAFIAHQSTYW